MPVVSSQHLGRVARASGCLLCVLAASAAVAGAPPSALSLEAQGFEQVARRRGVRVFKNPASEIAHLGAEGVLPAAPEEVRKALLDYTRHPGVVRRLAESRILERHESWLVVYQRLALPIISDRDFTILVRWGSDGDALWLTFEAANHAGPGPRDGLVRIPVHEGSWRLQRLAGGRATLARYQAKIDLAGWVPRWMARGRAASEVPELFSGICGLIPPGDRSGPCP